MFRPKQAYLSCFFLIVVIVAANSNVLFTYGYDVYDNTTYLFTSCTEIDGAPGTYWMTIWGEAHAFLYSYIPFVLLAIANVLLIIRLHQQNRINFMSFDQANIKTKRQKAVTISIMVMTILFILVTGTGAVVNFFIQDLVQSYTGNVILVFGDLMCFSFHSLNILSLLLTYKRFRKEFLNLIDLNISINFSSKRDDANEESNSVQTSFG